MLRLPALTRRAAPAAALSLLLLGCPAAAPPVPEAAAETDRRQAEATVRELLAEQAAAWSRGDLEAFVRSYADDTLFVSPSGLTRGRDEVLARYRRRYPDRAAMGRLTLDVEELRLTTGPEVSMLGDARPGDVHGARVVARWTLEYPDDLSRETLTGLTLIVFERRPDGWVIVEDASM